MSTVDLLGELQRRRIQIWSEGGKLKYEAPRGAVTPELRERLRAHKHEILESLAAARRKAPLPIPRADRSQPLPLSYSQRSMWLLWKLEPESAAYVVPTVVKLTGPLDAEVLAASFRDLRRRHETLRTVIVETPDGVAQVAREDGELEYRYTQLSEGTVEARRRSALELIRRASERPFDLTEAPPFRVELVRVDDELHFLLMQLHHINFDGGSNTILLRELWQLYEAGRQGHECVLPDLPIQYADFAAWQRERLQPPYLDHLLDYWRQQLEGELQPLVLPTRSDALPPSSADGDGVTFQIPVELTEKLQRLGQRLGSTMFMVLVGALRVLMYRYSGVGDFLIGTPTIRRPHSDTELVVGHFGNTLVLRNALNGDDSILDVLERERRVALESYEHQELPFGLLVEELAPDRLLGRNPLYRVIFLFGERAPFIHQVGQLEVEYLETETTTAKLDLGLWVKQAAGGGLRGHFEYSPRLFHREIIERLTAHFIRILEAMTSEPSAAVGEIALLSTEEERRILVEWNDTAAPLRAERTVPEAFAARAAATPDATAIIHGTKRVTYARVAARTQAIAAQLMREGARPGDLIGVCLERSPDLIASMLAVLTMGGAYLPIEPHYPSHRVGLMLEDAGARHLITDQAIAARLAPEVAMETFLCVDGLDESMPAGIPAEFAPVSPDGLAYVLYTSGSTGEPKGVMIEHRSVMSLIEWAWRNYQPEELRCVLAGTSACFDLSVFEIFVSLCGGYSLVLADSVLELPTLAARDEVTLLNTVPSVMRALLRMHDDPLPDSVTVVNLAGEPLDTNLVDEVYRRSSARRVFDLYGPTEATTYATCKLRRPGEPASIGRPIANTRAYVLDRRGQPVPVGVSGELHLAGHGIARGYLGRPGLSAECFVASTSPRIAESRLYRTGDLARFRRDGELEWVGRTDAQLKVRGLRVEPGEVRAALLELDGIIDAVAVGRRGDDGELQLAAYFVGDEGVEIPVTTVSAHLATRLPRAMLPTSFTRLDAMPLTPTGKVDVAQLDPPAPRVIAPFEAPTPGTEREISEIWSAVLGRDGLGRHDNFFDLGGTSMSAMLVVGRINAAFGLALSLRAMFTHLTIAAVARFVEQSPRKAALPPVLPTGFTAAPATVVQRHLWSIHRRAPNPAFLNLWHWVDQPGPLDRGVVERTLHELMKRHAILRSSFSVVEGTVWHVPCSEVAVDVAFLDLSDVNEPGARRQALGRFYHEVGGPFELDGQACVRFAIVVSSAQWHTVAIVVHHAAVDEWSLELLGRELRRIYGALVEGRDPDDEPPPLSYADYALWERYCLAEGLFERQLTLWTRRLAPPLEPLRFDWRESSGGDAKATTHRFELSAPLVDRLTALASHERTSLFIVCLAMLKLLLHRHTRQSDIRVSTNVSRRHRQDFEQTIGPLTDTMILRTRIDRELDPNDLLRLVRRCFIDSCAENDVPFEEIATRLESEYGIHRRDLAQVFFAFHDAGSVGDDGAVARTETDFIRGGRGDDFFVSSVTTFDFILYLVRKGDVVEGQLTLRGPRPGDDVGATVAADYLELLEKLVAHAQGTSEASS